MTQFSIDTHDTQLLKSETRDLRPKTRILIIAGGTGGHIFPALAVAHALKKQGAVIAWLGAETGMERQLVGDQFPLFLLPVKAIRGKSIWIKCIAPFRLLYTVFLAARIIQAQKPDVVLGMGGYASGPGCIAAKLCRRRLVIHEQNAAAGLTNRVLSRMANTVLQAFPNTFAQQRAAMTVGNPVRESILQISKKDFKTRTKPWHILILGGSQGASAINQLVSDWVMTRGAQTDFKIWHQTGKRDFEVIQKKYAVCSDSIYRVSPFIENITDAYAFADMVIARSGALTVSEIAAVGLPSILIPFPHAVDDHQYKNALFLAHQGAAVVCRENDLNAATLDVTLRTLFFDAKKCQHMSDQAMRCASRHATEKIIQACFPVSALKKVFFIGVGGIGMSGLAELLHCRGVQVSGSDVSGNALTQRLKKLGVTVFDSHDGAHITGKNLDLVVYSSAVSPDNPERMAAKAQSIPMLSRGQLLAELMQAECNIVVAGTHGKTTTTGLMTWMLEKAALNPTSMIGGVLRDRESPMHLGGNRFFVAESDESDASFLFLSPMIAVFTNVGPDHMETYAHDFERLKTSFLQLANKIPFDGFAVVCIDDPVLRDLIPRMQCRVITYGESADADFQLTAFQQSGLMSTLHVKTCDESVERFELNLPGKHNALNALSAIVIAHAYHLPLKTVQTALETFPGMGRRFHARGEIKVSGGQALLFDDYGHHPVELHVTLQSAKAAWPNRRVVMVFQPHRYSRTRDLMADFVAVLKTADQLVLTEVYAASEAKIVGADGRSLFDAVLQAGQTNAVFVPDLEALPITLQTLLRPNDVVILQGAGDIVKMSEQLL